MIPRTMALLTLLVALTGCETDEPQITETGTCLTAEATEGGVELEYVELSFSDDAWISEDIAEIITSEEELATFETTFGLSFTDTVDFSTEQILVAGVNVSSTCGVGDPTITVLDIDGAAHLEVEITNPDGTCSMVCDMAVMTLAAVVVSADTEASACARLLETCE